MFAVMAIDVVLVFAGVPRADAYSTREKAAFAATRPETSRTVGRAFFCPNVPWRPERMSFVRRFLHNEDVCFANDASRVPSRPVASRSNAFTSASRLQKAP